jgi:hypothetical protein
MTNGPFAPWSNADPCGFRAAAERAQKQFTQAVEMLVAACYAKHGAVTMCSGEGGGIWVEPDGDPLRIGEEHKTRIEALAGEYHARTSIPPERCRVVSRIEGFTWIVEFKERE